MFLSRSFACQNLMCINRAVASMKQTEVFASVSFGFLLSCFEEDRTNNT